MDTLSGGRFEGDAEGAADGANDAAEAHAATRVRIGTKAIDRSGM